MVFGKTTLRLNVLTYILLFEKYHSIEWALFLEMKKEICLDQVLSELRRGNARMFFKYPVERGFALKARVKYYGQNLGIFVLGTGHEFFGFVYAVRINEIVKILFKTEVKDFGKMMGTYVHF